MTSPATMRLMGLLLIVGLVAGCGSAETPAPDVVAEGAEAVLTLDDVQALRVEGAALLDELAALPRVKTPRGGVENDAANYARSVDVLYVTLMVPGYLDEMIQAIVRGEDDQARVHETELLDALALGRRIVRDAQIPTSER